MKTKLLNLDTAGLKFANSGEARTFSGYASVFNGLDSYGDMIAPGAYAKTLENRDRPIRMRWNHFGPVIGKFTEIHEDEVGLWVEGELTPGHSVAEDAAASLKHGAVDGLSIGYRVVDAEQRGEARLLKEIDLVEISIVEEPADLNAQISGFKSALDEAHTLKEIESLLREAAGLSKKNAAALVGRVRTLLRSDSVSEEVASEARQLFKGLADRIVK